ncbi:MAG: cell division protein FtsA [Capnocytophaga sp.]|nr:cell division protein FtsA [Capnocytophaga sp.]
MKKSDTQHPKYYVGLDIGTTKIVAMVGTKNEYGKIQILGYGQSKSDGIDKGIVMNITRTTQSIMRAVEDAQQKTGMAIKDVEVGIAGQHILSMQHSDYIIRNNPEQVIDERDLERLKAQVYSLGMQPGQEIIHILPQEYKVDGLSEIKDPIGMEGARLEASFHLVVGQVNSIRNISRCVEQAGLNLTGLTLEPLASAESVLDDEEKEAGIALVDIGGGTTDLAIFKDGIIRHTAVIPMGGNILTKDIEEGCAILNKYAEQLKVQYGSAWPGENKENEIVSIPGIRDKDPKQVSLKNLSKIIYARTTEIITLVHNAIKNYGHEEQKKKLIAGIVLTGGGSQLKHIKQLVEYITALDTRIGIPNEHLAGDSDERIASPIYATSIGLVMCAVNNKREQNHLEVKSEKGMNPEVEIEKDTDSITGAEPKEEEKKGKNLLKEWWKKVADALDNAE